MNGLSFSCLIQCNVFRSSASIAISVALLKGMENILPSVGNTDQAK